MPQVFNAYLEGEIGATSVFKGLPARVLKQFVPLLNLEEVEAGTILYSVGNPGDRVLLLLHGSVTILKGSTPLTTLSAVQGQAATTPEGLPIFGELALLDRRPRVLKAVVASNAKLLVLPVEQFAAAALAMPDVRQRLRRLKSVRAVDVG